MTNDLSRSDSSSISASTAGAEGDENPHLIATKEEEVDSKKSSSSSSVFSRCWPPPVRFILVGLMLLGAFTTSLSKVNINTAIIAMSPQSHPPTLNASSTAPREVTRRVSVDEKMDFGGNFSLYDDDDDPGLQQKKKGKMRKGKGRHQPYNPHHQYYRIYKVRLPFTEGEPFCGHYNGVGHLPPPVTRAEAAVKNGSQQKFSGSSERPPEHEFNWSEGQQDHLKGAFLIGYGLGLIPCGHAGVQQVVGVKRMVATGGLLHVALNLLSPVGARFSYGLFFLFRIGLGLATAMLVPSFFTLIQRWILDDEKR